LLYASLGCIHVSSTILDTRFFQMCLCTDQPYPPTSKFHAVFFFKKRLF
jgi:hypothetical protein